MTTDTKKTKFAHLPLSTSGPVDCALTGSALLNCAPLNKGSAFSPAERREFKLTGLLPANAQTLEVQTDRAYQQLISQKDDIAKNTFLTSLKDQNEVLYFKVCLIPAVHLAPHRIYMMVWVSCDRNQYVCAD
jgi:malate dehydrogenase (oxaloacetate-decarboxylating)